MRTKHTILYIDDEADNLAVFKACFGNEFTVLTSGSQNEAIQKLHEISIAVIVSDYKIPGKNGIEFFKEINLSSRIRFEF